MCGIVGYLGPGAAQPVLLDGLRRLEYRGYDSAGVAVLEGGALQVVRRVGKLAVLEGALGAAPLGGGCGIGHTRWATHGKPTEANAHPHVDTAGAIAVVHNGIIENHRELRRALELEGAFFRSQTDTEVLPHLIARHYAGDLAAAVRAALLEVRGAFAIAVVCTHEPGRIVAARRGSPLLIGFGPGALYLASDAPALMGHTRQVCYLGEDEIAMLDRSGAEARCTLAGLGGAPRPVKIVEAAWDAASAEKEGFAHFMLKEIHQQPAVLRHLLLTYAPGGAVSLPPLGPVEPALADLHRVAIVGCGTAWHAGLVGRQLIERYARVPVDVDFASEFRYAARPIDARTLVIAVSQSGETADTLEAVRLARRAGAAVIGIVNVPGSSIAREAHAVLYTHAGPEIGVASTKAYTAQIAVLALFALALSERRGAVHGALRAAALEALHALPHALDRCLAGAEAVRAIAERPWFRDAGHAMFIGRGANYPSALEGALKLKEIAYVHVEGYAAGEMKHGPIALVTPELPVVAIAVAGAVYEKTLSNIEEIRARGGRIVAIATEGDARIGELCDDAVYVPGCDEALSPLVAALPLQLLAYHAASALGRDVDQPRNLAKSVTVE